ncbi:MAG: diguanylate cyclase [Rubrivivax sp.]|nr:diguanylate cyclase [Rubrivivax sp.]
MTTNLGRPNLTTTLEAQLALATRQERPELGKSMAQPVLEAAEEAGDLSLQARALACIAQYEELLCRHRSAQALSTRAAQLFQALGNLTGEAAALTTVARSSSVLGRDETAVEAALLALELSKRTEDPHAVVLAQAQLGHTLAHCGNFEAAREALMRAEVLARECGSELDELVALVMQGACEAFRVVTLRHETGHMPTLEQVQGLRERLVRFVAKHDMVALAQPDQTQIQVFMNLVSGLFHCWCDDVRLARSALESARAWLDRTGDAPWMDTFEALVRCELAQVERDLPLAEQQARRMVHLGGHLEREQAALLGHLLACRVFELQGKHTEALGELKAMAARERRIHNESLSTRHEVVAWQLDMRRSEQSRRALQVSTAHFEKLSMEDPLTGIANRRCFESAAGVGLSHCHDSGTALCVAMLDVDHFKQVNDIHSHVVGDKVLQVVAALLTEHVRAEDLAARLAGDEFVILFRDTDTHSAWEACERLRAAISRHDWEQMSPGLAVSVSIGLAQSLPGDSLETLLRRSDMSMYERKNATRRPA